MPVAAAAAARVPQHPGREVERRPARAPWRREPARARRRPAADLQHPPPGDVAEQRGVGLAQALRAPDEVGVAEEVAVLGVVVVGVGVPPARGSARCDSAGADAAGARPRPCRAARSALGVTSVHRAIVPAASGRRRPHRLGAESPGRVASWRSCGSTWRLLRRRSWSRAPQLIRASPRTSSRASSRSHDPDPRVTAPRHGPSRTRSAPRSDIHSPEHPTTCPPTPSPPDRPAGRRSTTSGRRRTSSPPSTRRSSTSTMATSSRAPSSRSTATRSCSTSATRPRASSPRASCPSSTTSTPTRSSRSATRSRPWSSRRRTRKAG